ncbi:hypothetical protein [Kitasatospora indigofera]|uniref:hypothetical protein n=1 Tax=Kitasatospora indigofera TaxID=67307 RepID=UPI0033A2200E
MPKPRFLRLFCVGPQDRGNRLPAGVRQRLVVVVVLLTAAVAIALGVNVTTVVEAVALPSAVVKLADLSVGTGPGRPRSGTSARQGR